MTPVATLYLDLDDVLAETTRALVELARREFDRDVAYEDLSSFDFRESLSFTEEELDAFFLRAHESEVVAKLPLMTGVSDVLQRWDAQGHRLEIVTGRPPATRASTEEWIESHSLPIATLRFADKYGRFNEQPGAESLEQVLSSPPDLAFEDSLPVARHLAAHGVPVVLVDRPWNQHDELPDGLVRCETWVEVEAIASRRLKDLD
ncbi:MAG: hypothetical protein AAF533_20875 [Acidobacteriota bacterium]